MVSSVELCFNKEELASCCMSYIFKFMKMLDQSDDLSVSFLCSCINRS